MELTKKITTPNAITEPIIAFAAEMAPNHAPQYVQVRREPYARPFNCFYAVQEKIRRDGGEQVNGWIVWEHPKAYLSGEFHAVWRRSKGEELVCVANHTDGESRILFAPAPEQLFLGKRVPNRFKALTNTELFRITLRSTTNSRRL